MSEQPVFDANGPIPQHVAIIMDGNGRWAKKRGLERTEGHREGLNALRRVTIAAASIDIKVLTVYAFSTENWKRPSKEVQYLMSLPDLLESEFMPEIQENNVKIEIMGFPNRVPTKTVKTIDQAVDDTKNNTGLILNIAFNYGSRAEMVKAIQELGTEVQEGRLDPGAIDEEMVSAHLFTDKLGDYQDPDFLIRSSGEERLSNFLLWQLAYTEFYFPDTYWPDFDEDEFLKCIAVYQSRDRRYGGIQS